MDFFTPLQDFLMWGTIVNLVIMIAWFLVYLVAGEWARGMYAKWFPMPDEEISSALFTVVGVWGVLWVTFFLAPWLALIVMG